MKKMNASLRPHLWVSAVILFALLCFVTAGYVHVPLGRQVLSDGKRLYRDTMKKRDSSLFPEKKKVLQNEIVLLDSALHRIEEYSFNRKTLVEQLYEFADSSGFKTGRIEIGIPQNIAGNRETSISIMGNGNYRAVGKFTEKIENCTQSTRIRQMIIKTGSSSERDVFIDLAVREQGGSITQGEAGSQ